jgi:hypothetical protein
MTPDADPSAPDCPPVPESYRTFWDAGAAAPAPPPSPDDAYAAFSELAEV